MGLVALQAAVAPLWDADLWWLLRAGEDLLREGVAPRHNRYGFTAPAHPWVMHEWLLGALGAALVRAFGLPGVALLRVAATLTVGAFAWRVALRGARPLAAALAVAGMLALFGGRFESARPLGLAYAPAMVVLWAAFAPTLRARHALAAVLATALWTNAHGSFPLALVTLAAGAWEAPHRHRVALLAACAAVTLANPYGPRMHDLVARYLGGVDGDAVAVVHQRIVEWWPLHRAPLRMYSPPGGSWATPPWSPCGSARCESPGGAPGRSSGSRSARWPCGTSATSSSRACSLSHFSRRCSRRARARGVLAPAGSSSAWPPRRCSRGPWSRAPAPPPRG